MISDFSKKNHTNFLVFSQLNPHQEMTLTKPLLDIAKQKGAVIIRLRDRRSFLKPSDRAEVTYHVPPYFDNIPFLREWSKIVFLTVLFLLKRPRTSIGILFVPYGLFVNIMAKIFKTRSVSLYIGHDVDISLTRSRYRRFFSLMARFSNLNVVTGKTHAKILQDVGISPKKIRVLPPAVDTNFYHPPRSCHKKYDFLYLGRLAREKRVDKILWATHKLVRTHPNVKICIAGDGSQKQWLHELSLLLGIKERIFFAGFVEGHDKRELIWESKYLVLASDREGLPVSLLEAMACGTPAIVPEVGNISDVVSNGKNALIYDGKDKSDLLGAMRQAMESDTLYEKFHRVLSAEFHNLSLGHQERFWASMFVSQS